MKPKDQEKRAGQHFHKHIIANFVFPIYLQFSSLFES